MAVGKRTCGAKASGTTTRRRTKTPAKPAKPAKAKKKPLHSPPSKNSIVAKRKSVGNTAKSPVVRLTPGVDHVKENAPLHSHYKYIRRGYRAGLNVKETIWSAFQLHNETVNVWLHLIGALVMVVLMVSLSSNVHRVQGLTKVGVYNSLADASHRFEKNFEDFYSTLGEISPRDKLHEAREKFRDAKGLFYDAAKSSSEAAHQRALDMSLRIKEASAVMMEYASEKKNLAHEKMAALNSHMKEILANNMPENLFVDRMNELPSWPLFFFMVSATYCMTMSAMYHLFTSLSEEMMLRFQGLDLAGISFLICGSMVPMIYYSFCSVFWRQFYLLTFGALSSLTFSFSFVDYGKIFNLDSHRYRLLRTAGFICSGAFALFPVLHLAYNDYFFNIPVAWRQLGNMIMEGFLYLIGALAYLYSFPEAFFKSGRFDYFFASHQLWHLVILLASMIHYYSAIEMYEWRRTNECNCTEGLSIR
jgi:adiponectin receptor